jgi:hypothetical protein
MTVRELINLLSSLNPNAEVIIHRDCQNYGYGFIDKIMTGVFEVTDYGNDFWADQDIIIDRAQVKAICLYPEDTDQTRPRVKSENH